MSDNDEGYTVAHLLDALPDLTEYELDELVAAYPTYDLKNFRLAYVEGIKRGWDNYEITEHVVAATDQEFSQIKGTTTEGGEQSKTGKKLKRAAMRLLFLRYKANGLKAAQARAAVWNKHFRELTLRTVQDHLQDKSKKILNSK